MTSVSALRAYLSKRSDLDIQSLDLVSADGMLGAEKKRDIDPALHDTLMGYQRLSRAGLSSDASLQLLERGLGSAQAIASIPADDFLAAHADVFGGDIEQAAQAHRHATAIKGQVVHLWASVRALAGSPATRSLPSNTVPAELAAFFADQPDFADLFGNQNFCECEHCKSIFGPSAYFVDLMRIIDRYITEPNKATIRPEFRLDKRRPDLFDLPLTCANANDLIPTLSIVNHLLEELVKQHLHTQAPLHTIANAAYPSLLPYHDPLCSIRQHLAQLGSSMPTILDAFRRASGTALVEAATASTLIMKSHGGASIAIGMVVVSAGKALPRQARVVTAYDATTRTASFARDWSLLPTVDSTCILLPDALAIAQAILGLSLEQAAIVDTVRADEAALRIAYGLQPTQTLADLKVESLFRHHTAMSRPLLAELLLQHLGEDEVAAGMAHDFFINRRLAPGKYVHIVAVDGQPDTLAELDNGTLDRINRFYRLSRWSGIGFADLDWLLASFGAADIAADTLLDLAGAVDVRLLFGAMPYDMISSLWHDLKTTTSAAGEGQPSSFDRIYNRADLRQGAAPYHPLYAANPLYKDAVATLVVGGGETVSKGFGRARVLAALGFDDSGFNAVLLHFYADGASVKLDVPTLTLFYRISLLGRVLRLPPSELLTLLDLLGLAASSPLLPGDLKHLFQVSQALSATGMTVADTAALLAGSDAAEPVTTIRHAALKTAWLLTRDALLAPTSFAGSGLTHAQSRKAYAAIVKAGKLVKSVGDDYAAVLNQPGDCAIVLEHVEAADLAFLGTDPLKLSKRQIEIVARAMNQAYAAQLDSLVEQLADPLATSADMLHAVVAYADAALDDKRAWLPLLLTPVRECEKTAGSECVPTPAWRLIVETLTLVARVVAACAQLDLSGAELTVIAGIPHAFGMPAPVPLDITGLQSLIAYKALLASFRCEPAAFLDLLAMPTDAECGSGAKSTRLAALTGWPRVEICRIAQRIGNGPATYDTVLGIVRMQAAFDAMATLGTDTQYLANLLRLADLPAASDADWQRWTETASGIAALVAARYAPEAWVEIAAKLASSLNERRRDALEAIVLWQLGLTHADITDSNKLYAFLLLDIKIGGCASTSKIVDGLGSLQLYLQRCRLNLEPGVDRLDTPPVWWEWMMNYRVWEANRRIFVYPENYLIPSVRKSKSDLFRTLEDALLQANVDDSAVNRAYRGYLTGLEGITTLTYVDSYLCQRPEDVALSQQTMYLFARTRDEPYTYYHAMKSSDGVWSQWLKIDAAISASTITPVYAFGRLLVFWVELKQVSNPKVSTDGKTSETSNSVIYSANIHYSFQDVDGSWTAPQKVAGGGVVYIAPSELPFGTASGYNLFDMNSLFWRKVNVLHIPQEKLLDANTPGERIVVFYGPFLENDIDQVQVKVPPRPNPATQAENPQRYNFDIDIYDASVAVNQAVGSSRRGLVPLRAAQVLNINLNRDCLVRAGEFMLLQQNVATGVPPALAPQLDLAVAQLSLTGSLNPLHTNYAGDVTQPFVQSRPATRVGEASFVWPGIDAALSRQVLADVVGKGIVDAQTKKVGTFNRNTSLAFLFVFDTNPTSRAMRIAVVRDQLLWLKQAGQPVADNSFAVSAIDATASAQTLTKLVEHRLVDDDGWVKADTSSSTALGFLFDGDGHAHLLRDLVRTILLDHLAAPLLLGSVARDVARTMMVKNQPSAFIFNNGNESFLVSADAPALPLLESRLRVRDEDAPQRVHEDSFITRLIPLDRSQQTYSDLIKNYVLDDEGYVESFSSRTSLSYLFPGTEPPSLRTAMISEVRAILLGLPTMTALSYYAEIEAARIVASSFITALITTAESAETFAALGEHGVILDGVIASSYAADTPLDYLFPKSPADLRKRQIQDVRGCLDVFYAATWQLTVHDLDFRFERLSTAAMPRLMSTFFAGGVDALLALASQQAPVEPVQPFSQYLPAKERVTAPEQPDGAQVDFDGPYGLYFWELFFMAPQLVANSLSTSQRFEEALQWFHYIFDPTTRPLPPLTDRSLITRDIRPADAESAFAVLREKAIVTPQGTVATGFDAQTDLSFLFTYIDDPRERELMIAEVRNVLLNARLSSPFSRFWQFAPFRTYTLESLVGILTDKAQIAVYNNSPFDPFGIARLRIGAFEKAIVMQYVDNLIAWGDSLFAVPTRESLTAAMLVYVYAADLLGERPVAVGRCRTQAATTFAKIRANFAGEIPQFLIRMENLLPHQVRPASPDIGASAINDIYALFCVPENEQLLGYWDRVEDRLYKLRHCLDLEGRPLRLALFEPPINPLLLARNAANNGAVGVVLADASGASLLPYRFEQLITQATSLCTSVTILGSSLFQALQQRDAEKLSQLHATQELALLNLTTESKLQDIAQIKHSISGMQASLESANRRKKYYTDQADQFISPAEVVSMIASAVAVRFKVVSAALQTASSIAYAVPQAGSPFAMTYGGIQLGNTLASAANNADTVATVSDFVSQTASTLGTYIRRAQDWRFEATQAEVDAKMVNAQIAEANARLAGAEQDLKIHRLTIDQSKANANFLLAKFDNMELYGWMASRLTSLFYQTYKLALSVAQAAQNAYRFELDVDTNFINLEYWDTQRNGLLSGEALALSLDQLEQSYYRQNTRRFELTKRYSLLNSSPVELMRLREEGECTIRLDEAMFDFDFPGHYNRRLVSIALSFSYATDGYPEAHVTLTQTRNDTLTSPDPRGLEWMLNPVGDPPASVRHNLLANQVVAISTVTGDNDGSGLFELNLNVDSRYFPFEGTGAVSEWQLQMPRASNQFDFADIADLTVTARYTALDGGPFRDTVEKALAGARWLGGLYLDLASSYEDEWSAFMQDHTDPDTQALGFELARAQFPPNISDVAVTSVDLLLIAGIELPATSDFLTLIAPDGKSYPLALAGDWASLPFKTPVEPPYGEWSIEVDLKAIAREPQLMPLLQDGFLNPSAFVDMQVVFGFRGTAFPAAKKIGGIRKGSISSSHRSIHKNTRRAP